MFICSYGMAEYFFFTFLNEVRIVEKGEKLGAEKVPLHSFVSKIQLQSSPMPHRNNTTSEWHNFLREAMYKLV